ncbi:MAG: hypothetical protein IKD27_03165 [Oscillospiraceae bacterium]|nr:hypothetical protein [Oscillospiraceae bacterium]
MFLHLDNLETEPSKGGSIWLTIGEASFPEEGWYDLPGTLLEYWLPALQSFADGHTDFCKLGFLDGPYAVWLLRKADAVQVTCMEQGKAVLERQIDFAGFWNSVKKCVRYYERMKYLSTK